MGIGRHAKKARNGLKAAAIAFILGFVLIALVNFLVDRGILPGYSSTILWIFNIITGLISLRSLRRWGTLYAIGWLLASVVFAWAGLLDTVNIVLNIVAPSAFLIFRFVRWVRKPFSTKKSRR